MFVKSRFIAVLVIAAIFITLTGCAGVAVSNPVSTVDSQTVAAQLQFVDGVKVGPLYNMSVTVPDTWVNQFKVRNVGNSLYFDYVTPAGTSAPIFFIEALSSSQFWEQNGSLPGSYRSIVNRGDTYFIYHLPLDAYYSGLSKEEYTALAETVPSVISTFTAQTAN
ncbi:MAG TPA: hypothetical protein PKE64_12810 [Anaerolineae bacterium]|mgnify:CR=1 FL=1|nr:hypothetical protein [Anaerolineae bacterium]HMR64881.1 hypothetical protein [Anaerolineae bacterium]